MKQIWGGVRRRTDRISLSIYGALVLLGTGVGLLVGNAVPDPLVLGFAIASFVASIILGALAVIWSRAESEHPEGPLLGVVYPPEQP